MANKKFAIRANAYHKAKGKDGDEGEKSTHTKFKVVRQWGGTGSHGVCYFCIENYPNNESSEEFYYVYSMVG